MSIDILGPVFYLPLEMHRKMVLAVLADNANDSGHCWPSQTLIALKSSLSERRVRDHLKLLAVEHWLEILQQGDGRGRTTHYLLNTERISAEAQKVKDGIKADKADTQKQKADTLALKADTPLPLEPSLEPSLLEPSYTKAPLENLGGLPSPELQGLDTIRVKPILELLRTFPLWRAAADDGVWLTTFLAERPWFNLEEARKFGDYHLPLKNGRKPNWRLALRNWREPFGKSERTLQAGQGRRPSAAGNFDLDRPGLDLTGPDGNFDLV